MSENETKHIYQAVAGLIQDLDAIPKEQQVNFGKTKFRYRGIDDVQIKLFPLMKRHRVVLACIAREITPINDALLCLKATYALTSLVDGSEIVTVSTAYAHTRDDRGLSSAGSTAYKYAIFELFSIPTQDQQDNDHRAEESEEHNALLAKIKVELGTQCADMTRDQKRDYLVLVAGTEDFRHLQRSPVNDLRHILTKVMEDNAKKANAPADDGFKEQPLGAERAALLAAQNRLRSLAVTANKAENVSLKDVGGYKAVLAVADSADPNAIEDMSLALEEKLNATQ